ncbi:MAG: LTA synthase family protein [Bacteroidetes bacterium]|nr:LTA synthase family protein [Bacteroidota bacterium]
MKRKWVQIQGSIYTVLLARTGFVFLLFVLSRILIYIFNTDFFNEISGWQLARILFYGLRFDLSGFLMLNLFYLVMMLFPYPLYRHKWYHGLLNGYFGLANILGLMVNFIDIVYFRFTMKRMTADIFDYMGVGGDFSELVPQFLIDFWFPILIWLFFSVLVIFIIITVRIEPETKNIHTIRGYLLRAVLWISVILLGIVGIRGGFQYRPISIITASGYAPAKYIPAVINTPFSILRTMGEKGLKPLNHFKDEETLNRIYSPVHMPEPGVSFTPMNVMIIIMESLSLEHVGVYNHHLKDGKYQGFTPFLDSLSQHCLCFRGYANGKESIAGIPSVVSGIPSLMNKPYITSPYTANEYKGLADILKEKGYTTAFFHGGYNGTMGFDNFARSVGFERYLGMSEYNNLSDYDGKWGIFDEPFFQFTLQEIDAMKSPFLACLFSLSSHHPYTIPKKYAGVFRKGDIPVQETIMYADHALQQFFKKAQQSEWFNNTLFVITADHTSESYFPFYESTLGSFQIPIMYYVPADSLAGFSKAITQQIDIFPSILDYLGYEKPYFAFGSSVFKEDEPRFAIVYKSGQYMMVKDSQAYFFSTEEPIALYHLQPDSLLVHNMLDKDPVAHDPIVEFSRAFIQQYNNRMIENRISINHHGNTGRK